MVLSRDNSITVSNSQQPPVASTHQPSLSRFIGMWFNFALSRKKTSCVLLTAWFLISSLPPYMFTLSFNFVNLYTIVVAYSFRRIHAHIPTRAFGFTCKRVDRVVVNACCIFPEVQVWELERFHAAKVTSKVSQCHWNLFQSIGHIWCPISIPLQLCLLYLAPFPRYNHLFA